MPPKKRGTPADPLGVVSKPRKASRPVTDTGRAPRMRAPKPPKDIDDDSGRRPAMTYTEWQTSRQPARSARATHRVPGQRPANAPTTSALPVSGPGGVVPGPSSAGRAAQRQGARGEAVRQEASAFANRQAYMAAHGKPSVTGRAIGGAAGGGSAGASIGGAPGAAVGAALGAVGGGVGGARAKRQYKLATRQPNPARKLLVAEFAVCAVVAALAPMSDKKRDEPPGAWIKRMVAILGLFMVLGLVSAAGRSASKVAAGFGGLVAVVLLVSQRDVFVKIAQVLGSTDKPATGPGPTGVDTASMAGGIQLGSTEVNPTGSQAGRKGKNVARRVQ